MAQNSECKQYIVNSFWGIITSTTWTAHIASISLTVLHIYSNVLRIDYIQYREQSNVFSVGLRVFLVLNMFWLLYLKMNDLEIHFKPKRCREDQNTWELLLIHYWITCAIIHPPTPPPHPPPLHLWFSLKENKEWDQRCCLGSLTAKQIKVSKTVFK